MIKVADTTDGQESGVVEMQEFNTVKILAALREKLSAGAKTVKVSAYIQGGGEGGDKTVHTVYEGAADEAVAAFEPTCLDTAGLVAEFNKFVDVITAHSRLRGVMIAFVCGDGAADEGRAVHGLARANGDADRGDLVCLYNTNVANGDEFARKAGIYDLVHEKPGTGIVGADGEPAGSAG